MPDTLFTNDLPLRPRAVLRVGFAGRKELTDEAKQHLRQALQRVLFIMGHRLAALTPGIPVEAGREPRVAEFFARQGPPLLRLVTGLCEGADAVAAEELERIEIAPEGSLEPRVGPVCLETELAAVLPFDLPKYRESRPAEFRPEFDRQAAHCGYILTLDGLYAKPDPDTKLARDRRAKAYRAQSAMLLRHADILVAAANPDEAGKAGGTLETIRTALTFKLPVVFIHTGTGEVRLLDAGDDLASALVETPPSDDELRSGLIEIMSKIVADPNIEINESDNHEGTPQGLRLLNEYFDTPATPPLKRNREGKIVRRVTMRERFWTWVEACFVDGGKPRPKSDPALPAYVPYRSRATNLNYHYGGLYRGAFVVNYALAVAAVLLATLSLVLLGLAHTGAGEEVRVLATAAGPAVVADSAPSAEATDRVWWLFPVLLLLGVTKLGIVFFIARNTHRANHEKWNDMAVNYRYLAERLRALYYLPRTGSFQPPAASPPQYASRVVHQSAVDWLFNAIVRAVSPATLAKDESFSSHDGSGHFTAKIVRLQPEQTVIAVRDCWIAPQVVYHVRNKLTMGRLHRFTEAAGSKLSSLVIAIVALDIAIVVLELTHVLPHTFAHMLHNLAPWLIFLTAVMPAAVAALNGIRFQTECHRLAERSAIIRVILGGRPSIRPGERTDPDERAREPALIGGRWQEAGNLAKRISVEHENADSNVAAWSLDTLLLTERIADDFIREAAEWSVLYAKELPET